MKNLFGWLLLVITAMGCSPKIGQRPWQLIDKNATPETVNLFHNLRTLAENHILFGHQHATEYGHGWSGDENRSDVKSVTGSHPAVIGVDFAGLSGQPAGYMDNYKKRIQRVIGDTYNRGGVVTVAWHFYNPVYKSGFYWVDSISRPTVRLLIPGGSHHEAYKRILGEVAWVAHHSRGNDGNLVPMIFRPFHEFDGDWFWWGRSHSTVDEFKSLWRFTVQYLRDSLNVHNFIYAFSPDNLFGTEEEFTERYPGNEYVDMVGMDNYGDMGRYGRYNLDSAFLKLKIVSTFAKANRKLAAFTETGLESIPKADWWTNDLLGTLKRQQLNLSYVLVWRNDIKSSTHFYAPYPGHSSVPDFLKFYEDPYTLFEKDLKNIYKQW